MSVVVWHLAAKMSASGSGEGNVDEELRPEDVDAIEREAQQHQGCVDHSLAVVLLLPIGGPHVQRMHLHTSHPASPLTLQGIHDLDPILHRC